MTRVCPVCRTSYQDWVRFCGDCGVDMTLQPVDNDDDELESERTLSVEFTLLSGETISVREELEDPATEESVRRYADALIRQIGTDTIRTFAYWWGGEFYVDAVRLREVAAVSVSTVAFEDDDSEDWEE